MSSTRERPGSVRTIRGIGPKRERWLLETLGVIDLFDLADLEPEELSHRLRADGDPAAASAARWIEDARGLARELSPRTTETPTDVGTVADDGGSWEPFAAFVVEFQVRLRDQVVETMTYAHHVEADRTRSWNRISPDLATAWIATRTRQALDEHLARRALGSRVGPSRN